MRGGWTERIDGARCGDGVDVKLDDDDDEDDNEKKYNTSKTLIMIKTMVKCFLK